MGVDGGGAELGAVEGTFGSGTERRVCVWGYRRLVRALVLRTCFIGRFFIVLILVCLLGRLCFALCFIGRLFCSLLCHTRLDRVSGLCLMCLGWYLRNAIVLVTWGGTEIGC